MEYEKSDYVYEHWMRSRKQNKDIFQRAPNQAPSKLVEQSQVAMKKVMDVTIKDRKMTEWSFSSQHGGLIKTQPETLKQATLSDAIPIMSEIRYCVPKHIEDCRKSPEYPRLAGTFLNHHQLEEDTIDLSTIQAACEVLAGNIKIMQDKINDDEDQTPPLFYGSIFIPAKDVISPQDDPELFDFGNNDESVLWHSTALNDNEQLVSYLISSTCVVPALFPKGYQAKKNSKKKKLFPNGKDLSLMMFATMSQDHSNGKHGRLRALAIHGLVVYQNIIGGKSQEVESLIVSGGETAQFQGTGMLERLVQCVQLSQQELVGCKQVTLLVPKTSLSVQDAWKHYGAIKVSRKTPSRWQLTMDFIHFREVLKLPVYSPRSTFIKCYPSMVAKNYEKFIVDGNWSRFNSNVSNMVKVISKCLNSWYDDPLRWESHLKYKEHATIAKFAIDDIVMNEETIEKRAQSVFNWMLAQSMPSIPMAVITHKFIHALQHSNDSTEYPPMVSQTVLELLQPLTIEMKGVNHPNMKGSVFPIDSATYLVRCSRCHKYLFDKPTTLSVLLQFLPFWILVHNGLDPASFSQTAAYLSKLNDDEEVVYSFAQFGLSLFSNRTAFLEAHSNMTQMAKHDSDFASGKMIRCSPDPDAAEYQKDRINFVDAMKQDAFSGDELKLDGNIIGTKIFVFLMFEQTSMLNAILKEHVEKNCPPAEPHFDPFQPSRFCPKTYQGTAKDLDKKSSENDNVSYQNSLTLFTSWQLLFSGHYLRDFHFIEEMVYHILFDNSSLTQINSDGVGEAVSKLAEEVMYQDTTRNKFGNHVRKNYPKEGKLGLSVHKHVNIWDDEVFNCIYVGEDDSIPIDKWSQRRPYGWKVSEETFVHQSHASWKDIDQDLWFGTYDVVSTTNNDTIQAFEEIVLTEMSIIKCKVERHRRERRYYLLCDWKTVLKKNPDYRQFYPKLFLSDYFEADNDYITKFPFSFIEHLDNFNGQWRRLPRQYLSGLKKKIKEHVTASVSSVRLHSKMEPGVPFIEIKERVVGKGKGGPNRSKSRGKVITNSKAIQNDFSHERWMGTRLLHLSNVGSFESVHLGYGAKFNPQPGDGDALPTDNAGDEKCRVIAENMKLSCSSKTEETSHPQPLHDGVTTGNNSGDEDSSVMSEDMELSSTLETKETAITSSHNSHPPIQIPSTWKNNYHQKYNVDKLCAPGAVAMLLDAMGLPSIAKNIWTNRNERCSSTLAKFFQFNNPKQIQYAETEHYFEDPLEKNIWILQHGYKFNYLTLRKIELNQNPGFLENITQIGADMPLLCVVNGTHAGGSMATTNHVIGIWKNQVLDVESACSYPLCKENLDFTCGTEVKFNEMTYGIALIPSRYAVSMAYHNSVHLMATSDLIPEKFVFINKRRKRKRKKNNKT